MLIHSASQLITMSGGPQRGADLGRLEIITDGAILVRDGIITEVGDTNDLRNRFPDEPEFDAGGRVVMPGLVDPHTHAIWAGDRAAEFEMRLQGKSYMEIMAAGGGIASTVRATRLASLQQLIDETRPRLRSMFKHGTTTAEVKTGYGLQLSTELRMLQALLALDAEGPLDLTATFLGAHAVPPEYKGSTDDYVTLVCDTMLPMLKDWWPSHAAEEPLPFVDVFCETGVFSKQQSQRILEHARDLGFPVKIHADEFDNLGGATLAAELKAASADHLVATSERDMQALAASDTVAVALPCTPFGLGHSEYTPAKKIIEAGGMLAIATDLNPGTAWCESMQFAIALACRHMQLTPAQAIVAATINAAAAIWRESTIGSLEAGKQADLLILQTDDYRHLGYRFGGNLVEMVIKRGQFYPVGEAWK